MEYPMNTSNRRSAVANLSLIVLLSAASATQAALPTQTVYTKNTLPSPTPVDRTSVLYTAKFVCGGIDRLRDEQSDIDPVASPYEDFEPGRYATAFNILNVATTTRTANVFVAAEGLSTPLQVERLTLTPFETRRIGCMNLMDKITDRYAKNPLFGQLFEGFLYFTLSDDVFAVEAVYSYAYEADDGYTYDGLLSKGGLGASIDVVKVRPREISGVFLQSPTQ